MYIHQLDWFSSTPTLFGLLLWHSIPEPSDNSLLGAFCRVSIQLLKQRSYARDNEESELIHTSLMNGKYLNDSEPPNVRPEEEANFNFTIGGGGVYAPISWVN